MELRPISPTTKGPADRFTGDTYGTLIYHGVPPSRMIASIARFTPCSRTNWHSHAVGQTLYITDGLGFVGTRDGSVLLVRAGDTVYTPPGQEHWHGATRENFMIHLTLLEDAAVGETNTWLEPVTDDQYRIAHAHAGL
jgi:quercetin dioxygenase-like cupin family protein